MAEAFHGTFTALFVETSKPLNEAYSRQLQNNLKLAEKLGARITTVYGDDPAVQIAQYARVSGVSKIVIGRSRKSAGRSPYRAAWLTGLTNWHRIWISILFPTQARRSSVLPAAGMPGSRKANVFRWQMH